MSDMSQSPRADLDDDLARLTESLDREVRSFGVAQHQPPVKPSRNVLFAAGPEAIATAAIAIGAAAMWLASALPY